MLKICFRKIITNEIRLIKLQISNSEKLIVNINSFLTLIKKHTEAINMKARGDISVKILSSFVFKFDKYIMFYL